MKVSDSVRGAQARVDLGEALLVVPVPAIPEDLTVDRRLRAASRIVQTRAE